MVSGGSIVGSVLSSKKLLSGLIDFQLSDFTVGGVDGNGDLLSVLLISNDLLDVDAPLSSVNSKDLSGLAFDSTVDTASLDKNGVSLSYWNRSGIVLGSEFLTQVAAHHLSSNGARGGEVSLS